MVRLIQNPTTTQEASGRQVAKYPSLVLCAERNSKKKKWFLLHEFYKLSPWVRSTESKTEVGESAGKITYPVLTMELYIERKWAYWWWNAVLPLFLIVAASFSSMLITFDNGHDRLMTTLTMLLTTVAFKTHVSSHIPKVNFVTLIDQYR